VALHHLIFALHYTICATHQCILNLSNSVGIQYPPPLECILDNLIAITCVVGLFYKVIPLNPELNWYNLVMASNSLNHNVNPPAHLDPQMAFDHVTLSHWFR
jgi:hypothetical protein